MNFAEIINQDLFKLPIVIPEDRSCDYRFLASILKEYTLALENISEEAFVDLKSKSKITKKWFLKTQNDFQLGITNAFAAYLNGLPAQAYTTLEKTLSKRTKKYKNLLNTYTYPPKHKFYKIRITDEVRQLNEYEMVHIPFDKRHLVKTQRYSIPGFPCIYLGTSLYSCWEELLRPNINNFQSVVLESQKEITLLDLTPIGIDSNLSTRDFYKYLITWPLIAACSIKVKKPIEPFKSEYVMPQLLMQWVKSQETSDRILGIRYASTHINDATRVDPRTVNIAMPAYNTHEAGLCTKIGETFNIAGPISWQLMELSTGGELIIYNKEERKHTPTIEIINGRRYPYYYSVLGKIENYLDGMETKPIITNTIG